MNFFAFMLAAVAVSANSLPEANLEAEPATVDTRQAHSCCYPFASPKCCVKMHCRCGDSCIYLMNDDDVRSGGGGCNPPWAYVADIMSQLPRYCC